MFLRISKYPKFVAYELNYIRGVWQNAQWKHHMTNVTQRRRQLEVVSVRRNGGPVDPVVSINDF
jgi:hypothetical protein